MTFKKLSLSRYASEPQAMPTYDMAKLWTTLARHGRKDWQIAPENIAPPINRWRVNDAQGQHILTLEQIRNHDHRIRKSVAEPKSPSWTTIIQVPSPPGKIRHANAYEHPADALAEALRWLDQCDEAAWQKRKRHI